MSFALGIVTLVLAVSFVVVGHVNASTYFLFVVVGYCFGIGMAEYMNKRAREAAKKL